MAITQIITHRLHRNSPDTPASIQLAKTGLPLHGELEEMAYTLKTQFIRKGGKSYGRFSDDIGQHPFAAWLKDAREGRSSLQSFSEKAVQQLLESTNQTDAVLNGYCFFVEEKLEAGDSYSIYWLEHESGHYLDGELALNTSHYLDLNGFTLAAKVNCADWDAGESTTYLTIIRGRGDKLINETFTDWVGFSDKADIKTETHQFLTAVESFAQTLEEPVARVTRAKVADFCLEQNKAGKTVTLQALADTLAEETKSYAPSVFTEYVQKTEPNLKEEFIPHAGEVRSFVRISGRNDSLSMSFASECLGEDIQYDFEKDQLTIRNIPSSLKKQLLAHLKQQQKPGII